MNIMESDLQGFIDRLSHLSLLNVMQLSIEVVVGNYVAITFSRLKRKPDKSKHHFEKLYKAPFTRIRIFLNPQLFLSGYTAIVHTHTVNSQANPEIFESALQSGNF